MSARVEAGRGWQPGAAGAYIAPAVLVLMGLLGVTTGPLLDVRDARQGFDAAEERLEEFRLEQARLAELKLWVDPERVEALTRELDQLLPADLAPLEVFTLVRLAAQATGLALEAVDLGPVYDLVAEIDGETIYMQEVRVSAQDHPVALMRFLRALREGGYPTAVLELTLARQSPASETFQARFSIGLLYRGAPPPPLAAGAFDDPHDTGGAPAAHSEFH